MFFVLICDSKAETQNEQFMKYIDSKGYSVFYYEYPTDLEELINVTIENNNNSWKKVTLIYQNTNYITTEELKELLDIIDMDGFYKLSITYDDYLMYIASISIELNDYKFYEFFSDDIEDYEGEQLGSEVKYLINLLAEKLIDYDNIKVKIIYTNEEDEEEKYTITADDITGDYKINVIYSISDYLYYNIRFEEVLENNMLIIYINSS